MADRALVSVSAKELLGYDDLGALPESTGTDKLVLKRGNLFAVAGRLGDIGPAGARDQGAYFEDTRFLSLLKLTVAGGPPVVLSTQSGAEYTSQVDLTVTSTHFGGVFQDPVNFLHLRREQLIDEHFVERLTLTNYLVRDIDYWVEYEFACDFADQFEVRGARRRERGTYFRPLVEKDSVTCAYQGRDGVLYRAEIFFPVRAPDEVSGGRARFNFHLGPNESATLELHALPSIHAVRSGTSVREAADAARQPGYKPPSVMGDEPESGWTYPGSHPVWQPPAPRRFDDRIARARADYRQWADASAHVHASEEAFNWALTQAVADLKALSIYWEGRRVVSAGVPWYASPFGRDALITGFQALLVNPDVAREALLFLAAHQGKKVDDFREEEPGKILHEIRRGELARTGEVPHTPYYGSVDSTPLFIILYTEYLQWTGDRATGAQLLPAAEARAALDRECGDKDGDGFVEYQRKTERGLRNQGWKDSWDGVPHLDGTPAEPPIALVEVQGYCIDARRRMARLYRQLGRREDAARCALAAQRLLRAVDEAFWMEKAGTYAHRARRTQEPGQERHLEPRPPALLPRRRRAARPARRADADVAGELLRLGHPHARPRAAGLQPAQLPQRHGLAARQLAHRAGLLQLRHAEAGCAVALRACTTRAASSATTACPSCSAAWARGQGELVVSYPVSCSPQAWASGALFLLLRACLGLYPDATRRLLKIVNPQLPAGVTNLTLERLRVGDTRVTVEFTRSGESCFASVRETEGHPLAVRIEVGAQADEA